MTIETEKETTARPSLFEQHAKAVGQAKIEAMLGMPVVYFGKGPETGLDWYIRVGCFCDYDSGNEDLMNGSAQALADAKDEAIMLNSDTMMGSERSVKARFRELLAQHPELTRPRAYLIAVMEIVGYQGYLVPPELAPGVLAKLESNDPQADLD